jgi:hypothetical protein
VVSNPCPAARMAVPIQTAATAPLNTSATSGHRAVRGRTTGAGAGATGAGAVVSIT